jgi:hypothetical protein
VADIYVNGKSKYFNASICTKWAKLDGQTAQHVDRMAVVLDVRESLSPQAP